MSSSSYTLFEPKSHERSYIGDYPELKEFEEFEIMSNKEMLYVWYFANITSPFAHIKSKRERARLCISKVWGDKPPAKFKDEALTGQYSSRLRDAIERMGSFVPNIRNRAKNMVDRVFSNYERILDTEVPEGDDDSSAKKREEYVNLSTKISKDIPLLVKQIESGYGIKSKSGSGAAGEEANIMDQIRESE